MKNSIPSAECMNTSLYCHNLKVGYIGIRCSRTLSSGAIEVNKIEEKLSSLVVYVIVFHTHLLQIEPYYIIASIS
jgi:hypothetical protein